MIVLTTIIKIAEAVKRTGHHPSDTQMNKNVTT